VKEVKEVKEEVLWLAVRTENDVMEPKRRRSFSQLDRLSLSAMTTKEGGAKQR